MGQASSEPSSIDEGLKKIGRESRELLWVITRALEPLPEKLIERVFRGEALNVEMLRKLAEELASLPEPIRIEVEAQLPAELRADLATLATLTTLTTTERADSDIAQRPPLESMIAELVDAGLIERRIEDGDVLIHFDPRVASCVDAWMLAHPEERGGRSEEEVWKSIGERLLGAYEALANADDDEIIPLAEDTAERALRYFGRSLETSDLARVGRRMLRAAKRPSLKGRVVAGLEAAAEAQAGEARFHARAEIAEALLQSVEEGGIQRALEAHAPLEGQARAIVLLDQAVSEAEEMERWAEAMRMAQRLGEAALRFGRHSSARDAFRRAAANARRAGVSSLSVIAMEIQALHFALRLGGDADALDAQLSTHLEALREAFCEARPEEAAKESEAEQAATTLIKALDLGVESDLLMERWQAALDRLDEIEGIERALGAKPETLARTRCRAYVPLVKLGRFDDAEHLLVTALSVFRAAGDAQSEVGTLSLLSDLWDERGEMREALSAALAALSASAHVESAETRARCHHNLAMYYDKAGNKAAARDHELADLVYRALDRLDVSGTLQSVAIEMHKAAAQGERYELPRLSELLTKPDFSALRRFIDERKAAPAALQAGLDQLIEAVRARPGVNAED